MVPHALVDLGVLCEAVHIADVEQQGLALPDLHENAPTRLHDTKRLQALMQHGKPPMESPCGSSSTDASEGEGGPH